MFRYLIKLRNKSESEKKKILIILALIIMSLVVFSWVKFKKVREEKQVRLGSSDSLVMIEAISNRFKVFLNSF